MGNGGNGVGPGQDEALLVDSDIAAQPAGMRLGTVYATAGCGLSPASATLLR